MLIMKITGLVPARLCFCFLILSVLIAPGRLQPHRNDLCRMKEKNNWEPLFEKPLGNHTFLAGREAILTCSIKQTEKFNVRNFAVSRLLFRWVAWLRCEDMGILTMRDKRILSGPRYSIAVEDPWKWQLIINPVLPEDVGCYMCQINTLPSIQSQIGCIQVEGPPDIITDNTEVGDISIKELENATLECKATGHPAPNITWRREDNSPILLRQPNQREFYEISQHQGAKLFLWRVDRRQMGNFFCIASNNVPPAVSRRIQLLVNFPPTVEVPSQLLGAPLGTDVQLKCHIEAFPKAINYWVKNKGNLLLAGPKYEVIEEEVSYKTILWLTIKSFDETDTGAYTCVSINALGKSEGITRVYQMKNSPTSEDYPNEIRAAENSDLSFL